MRQIKQNRSHQGCGLRKMGQVFNANTPENHHVVFKTDEDFMAGMSILAISARMFPSVIVYAFQLMSNHIHLIIGGDEREIRDFFVFFVGRLDKYFEGAVDLSGFVLKLFPVSDLAYFRNAVDYVNRNGFVVNSDVTPFSYPWGSSGYFFQPIRVEYDTLVGKPIGFTALRAIMHSRSCDHLKDMKCVKGCVSPLEFCHVTEAESAYEYRPDGFELQYQAFMPALSSHSRKPLILPLLTVIS